MSNHSLSPSSSYPFCRDICAFAASQHVTYLPITSSITSILWNLMDINEPCSARNCIWVEPRVSSYRETNYLGVFLFSSAETGKTIPCKKPLHMEYIFFPESAHAGISVNMSMNLWWLLVCWNILPVETSSCHSFLTILHSCHARDL